MLRDFLIGSDYDGTTGNTFAKGPGIITVKEAYRLAIERVLGEDYAEKFVKGGGHRNRSPLEIMKDLVPDAKPDDLRRYERESTNYRIKLLRTQIGKKLPNGKEWGGPIDGFAETWTAVNELKRSHSNLKTAIISAGHTAFIAQFFEHYGLQLPDAMVTADVLSEACLSIPPEEQAKPAVMPMRLARVLTGVSDDAKILYIGDDPTKDRLFAENSGAEFVLVKPGREAESWQEFLMKVENAVNACTL